MRLIKEGPACDPFSIVRLKRSMNRELSNRGNLRTHSILSCFSDVECFEHLGGEMTADQAVIITAYGTIVLAIATVALAAATIILIVVGLRQISEIKSDAQKQRALEVCNRSDSCAILH